jgi:hypothetical protein
VDVAFVVRDEDALPFTLEQAGFAYDTLGAVHSDRLLPAELELRRDVSIVNEIRKSIPRLQVEDGDRAYVFAMRAARAAGELDIDQNHAGVLARRSTGGCYLGFGRT